MAEEQKSKRTSKKESTASTEKTEVKQEPASNEEDVAAASADAVPETENTSPEIQPPTTSTEGTTAEGDETENAAAEATSEQTSRIHELVTQFKYDIEHKDWDKLKSILPPSIWLIDRSVSSEELISTIEKKLEDADDIELSLIKLLKTELTETGAQFSATCQLFYNEKETWQEKEENFDLHMGFSNGETSQISYMGITSASTTRSIAEAPTSLEGYFAKDESYFSPQASEESTPYFGTQAFGESPYFGTQALKSPAFTATEAAPPTKKKRHHLVYMPVVISQETLQCLLDPNED